MATAEPAPVTPPRPTPPKLNPVRVPIVEEAPGERIQDFREVLHAYSKEDAVLEAKRCIQCRRPWCVEACPISQDAREYIRLIAVEDWDGAARVTLREDPLSECLCRVCYHYCEDACVVKKKGVPIAIRHLKRAAMDFGNTDLVYVASRPKHQRVAVVGGGPAGMEAAWELGLRGYSVTVFEQDDRYGGLMQTIPSFRMTDEDVEKDRARYRNLDVTWVKNDKVGTGYSPEKLLEDGYQAVLITIGTSAHRALGVPGEHMPGVVPALGMLRRVNRGEPITLGRKIVVVGGGDVAMDAVRTSLRISHGSDVTLVYRRTKNEMPADAEELAGAEHEGVHFVFLKAPVRVAGDQHVTGLVVQSMELGPPDAGGRRAPIPVPGSEETIPCDTIVAAIGQQSDLSGFSASLDLKLTSQGWPQGKGPGFATAIPGVFAVGGRSVVYAMGSASQAAEAIDAYLAAKRGEPAEARPDPFGGPETYKLPAGYTTPIRS